MKKKRRSDEKGKDADKDKEAKQERRQSKRTAKGKEGEKKDEVKVTIDLDGIGQRIVAMPIKAANYVGLDVGKTGVLFLSEIPDVPRFDGADIDLGFQV